MSQKKERDIGIGHNSKDTAGDQIELHLKNIIRKLVNYITFEIRNGFSNIKYDVEQARHGKTLADRIDAIRDAKENVHHGFALIDILERTSYSTHWGKMALTQEAKYPDKGDRYSYVNNIPDNRTALGEYEDQPLTEENKKHLRSLFCENDKDVAEYLIKENEEAWSWYEGE
jgi:hypothetical protein